MKLKSLTICLLSSLLLVSCKGYSNTISIDEINDKIDNQESFIYFLGKDDCNSCQVLERNIKRNKLDKDIYYVNINDLSSDQYNTQVELITNNVDDNFMLSNGYNLYKYAIYSPSIINYHDGKIVSVYVGSMSKTEVEEFKYPNFIDLYYYSIFLNKIEIEEFEIYFCSSNISKNDLKELRTKNAYFIKYSSLTSSDKNDLIDKYNNAYSENIRSLDEVDIIYLNYIKN